MRKSSRFPQIHFLLIALVICAQSVQPGLIVGPECWGLCFEVCADVGPWFFAELADVTFDWQGCGAICAALCATEAVAIPVSFWLNCLKSSSF